MPAVEERRKTTMLASECLERLRHRRRPRSTWERAVLAYAVELMERDVEAVEGGYIDEELPSRPRLLERRLLNGADSWRGYSWGGCSLCNSSDIAERVCTPSEFKRKRQGALAPNKNEEWLDVQARALHQAFLMIRLTAIDERHS